MTEGNVGISIEQPARKKRLKIDVACDPCRSRKVKCDGSRPVCGVCSQRKGRAGACKFSRDSAALSFPLPQPQREIEESPDSISSLSHDLVRAPLSSCSPAALHPQSATNSAGLITLSSAGGSLQAHDTSSTAGSTAYTPDLQRNGSVYPAASATSTQRDTADGVSSMTGPAAPDGLNFFGSSSASSFMQQLKSAVDVTVPGLSRRPSQLYGLNASSASELIKNRHSLSSDYVLPPRRVADDLLALYWKFIYPLYPFPHRGRFERAYSTIWTGEDVNLDEPIFVATLNAIFALTCQLSNSFNEEERSTSSALFYARSEKLLQASLWKFGSIETIQCLLIAGQYLQSTNNAHQCWMVIGHAIRVAQGLGLDLPYSSNYNSSSMVENELAKRIWHGCVAMDTVLSMTFGRPSMISESQATAVPLPLMMDDDCISPESELPASNPPSMMAFYIKSLELYSIVSEILSALYIKSDAKTHNTIDGVDKHELKQMTTIWKIDRDLMRCGQSLPSHLRISSLDSLSHEIYQRQAVIFRTRFLHARILLFRPILSQLCLPPIESMFSGTILDESLDQHMVFRCSVLCLRAAHDIIHIINLHFGTDREGVLLPAWWYCVFYLYTAGTVLLASRLRPSLEQSCSNYSVAESWSNAIRILKALERYGEHVQRCVTALEILSATISIATEDDGHLVDPHGKEIPIISNTRLAENSNPFNNVGYDTLFEGISFDPNDMSWLNSMPGII